MVADDAFVDVCKEKQISDEEFLTNISDKENDKTRCPSECVVEDWDRGKEKGNESKESPKQGYFTTQLAFPFK